MTLRQMNIVIYSSVGKEFLLCPVEHYFTHPLSFNFGIFSYFPSRICHRQAYLNYSSPIPGIHWVGPRQR